MTASEKKVLSSTMKSVTTHVATSKRVCIIMMTASKEDNSENVKNCTDTSIAFEKCIYYVFMQGKIFCLQSEKQIITFRAHFYLSSLLASFGA